MPQRLRGTGRRKPALELLGLVAGRFRALAEPARLAILHALEDGERSVSQLVSATRMTQGNLSKHLQQLYAAGFVTRRRDGLFIYYMLADDDVLALCELMCGRLEADVAATQAALTTREDA